MTERGDGGEKKVCIPRTDPIWTDRHDQEFYEAIRNGEISVVRELIEAGADVNKVYYDGKTPLIEAVQSNNEGIVQLLIDADADVNTTDNPGYTALMWAVINNNKKLVCKLLEAGADVNIGDDKENKTALFCAFQFMDNEYLCRVKEKLVTDVYIYPLDNQKESIATKTEILQMLIEEGNADVNAKDVLGRTPLFYAISKSIPLSSYLIENGANLMVKDNYNLSILSFLIENCMICDLDDDPFFYPSVPLDMKKGLDLFHRQGVERHTILDAIINMVFCKTLAISWIISDEISCLYNILYVAREYIKSIFGVKIDLRKKKIIDKILSLASNKSITVKNFYESLVPQILPLLIELGANPNSADVHGNTALHFASCLSSHGLTQGTVLNICHLLENVGASFNIKNVHNQTPLLFCCNPLDRIKTYDLEGLQILVDVCGFLLDHGSSVEETTRDGQSVFHFIFILFDQISDKDMKGEIMKLLELFSQKQLIKKYLTINKKDDCLNSPLHLWASIQVMSVHGYGLDSFEKQFLMYSLKLLMQCGVIMNDVNKNDETPLHLCKTWTAVNLLLDAGVNPKVIDSEGRTPLLAAAKRKLSGRYYPGFYADVVAIDPNGFWKTALEKGLDLWVVDMHGESLLSVLVENKAFELAKALVEVACNGNYLHSDTISASLLMAVCRDESTDTKWKSILVEMILKSRKSPISGKEYEVSPLHVCCRNIVRSSKTSLSFQDNVHWTIAKQLLQYGADFTIPDDVGQTCLDIAEKCPELKDLLMKPIDDDEIPIVIPWTSVSKTNNSKLGKVARKRECRFVETYWYHKDHLAAGSFGAVFAGINEKDGREVAIKRIEKLRLQRPEDKREISNLTALADCEQIIRYLHFFEDEYFTYIVLELMEGNLDDLLHETMTMRERENLCQDAVKGLRYLHIQNILHRDLKPTNILYRTHPYLCLKIADFGLSRCIDSTDSSSVYGTNAGTRCWIAPEVLMSKTDHTKSSDVFACGLVLHYILSVKKHPFAPPDSGLKSTFENIHETELNVINGKMEGWDDSLCPEAAQLVKAMLNSDENERPSADEVLHHPFFWTKNKKLGLLIAVGNQPEIAYPRAKRTLPLTAVEIDLEAHFTTIVKYGDWNDPGYVHMPAIYTEMTRKRKSYDTRSVVELVRFIRNAYAYVTELSQPYLLLEDFVFLEYFPNLVMEVYKAVTTHGWDQTRVEIKDMMLKGNESEPSALKYSVFLSKTKKRDSVPVVVDDQLQYPQTAGSSNILTAVKSKLAGADVNKTDDEGKTALFYAVQQSDNESGILALINAGADVNMTDNEGKTALFYAVQQRDNESVLRTLIDAGAKLSVKDDFDRTPLFYAIAESPSIAKCLLDTGGISFGEGSDCSVLTFYIDSYYYGYSKSFEICEGFSLLIEQTNVDKKTIVEAIASVVFSRTLYIKSGSSDIDVTTLSKLLRLAQDYTSRIIDRGKLKAIETILMITKNSERLIENASEDIIKIFSQLIELGAKPNNIDSDGNTAMHYATQLTFYGVSQERVTEICQQLVELKVPCDTKNHDNKTPLLFCLTKAIEMISAGICEPELRAMTLVWQFLTEHTSYVEEKTARNGETILHLTLEFLQQGLCLTETNESRIVVCDEALKLLQLFVDIYRKKKIFVNVMDKAGNTPLHLWAKLKLAPGQDYSASITSTDNDFTFKDILKVILQLLLGNNGQLNEKNCNGETPLHLCRTWAAVNLLLDAGANPNVVDSSECTPLLVAAQFVEKQVPFYPDVELEANEFWRSLLGKGLDLWSLDKQGKSILNILVECEARYLCRAMVEVACEENQSNSANSIVFSLLITICKDKSTRPLWKSDLVEIILKSRKCSTYIKSKDSPLHLCCQNIVREYESKHDSHNVHWNIAQWLLLYGADYNIQDMQGQSCLQIAEACPPLKQLLIEPVDIDKIPVLITTWIPVSKAHQEKLAKVARGLKCKPIQQFLYHQEHIASGSFGAVYVGIHEKDGREVAIKRIEKWRMEWPEDKHEITLLIDLKNCEQVVSYFDFIEHGEFSYIVLELMEGNLEDFNITIDTEEKFNLCLDIAKGLKFLHKQKVLHRDLKPTNILYGTTPKPVERLCLKIADFGLSRHINSTSTTVYGTNAGTRCWIAPEVLKSTMDHTKSSDVFACGLVLHYILSVKKHPFAPPNCDMKMPATELETQNNIIADKMEGWDDSLCLEEAHLVKTMLNSNEDTRPSADEIVEHPFFWPRKKKIDFLIAVGNQPEIECPRAVRTSTKNITDLGPLTAVETDLKAEFNTIVKHGNFDDPGYVRMPDIYTEMTKKRKYDTHSVVELLRFIRNAYAHVSDKTRTTQIRKLLLEDFVFLEYFPNLVIEVYKVVTTYGWDQKRKEINNAMKSMDK